MMKLIKVVLLGLLAGNMATAETKDQATEPVIAITKAFQQVRPEWQLQSIKTSKIPGIYKVSIQNGPSFYSTADGEYFIAGDLYQVTSTGFVNLAEQERAGERHEAMTKLDRGEMIIFSPEGEVKDHITVFTDIDCGYCRKLHNEVPAMNAMGIEVRYLAYPRAGVGSKSYQKIVTAYCDKDPNTALTNLKQGKVMSMNLCKDNPVEKQFILGQELGVTGTPAIITSTGMLLPGYMPAQKLADAIGLESS